MNKTTSTTTNTTTQHIILNFLHMVIYSLHLTFPILLHFGHFTNFRIFWPSYEVNLVIFFWSSQAEKLFYFTMLDILNNSNEFVLNEQTIFGLAAMPFRCNGSSKVYVAFCYKYMLPLVILNSKPLLTLSH